MKKIIILILLLVLPLVLSAQLSGLGTYASPYSGTFQGNLQWNTGNFSSGKVYIGGDVTIDNEQLVIGSGMKIVFISAGADLIINGTGSMDAIGTSGSGMITFTADFNNNSSYGETGERWGHIIFNNPSSSNQSTLEYCIIEWGDVSSGSNTTSYGGGIYSNIYSNLIISNSTIRNNKATHGGGVMAYNGSSSPTFINCFITENTATISGGGIYLPSNCTSLITNCIVSNNSSGSGGGGGIFLEVSGNVRLVNSIFVKNTTSNTARGYNIQYYNISSITNRPSFKNCIAWGSDNSITHLNYSQQATDFVNCAIQDVSTPASAYSNCIDLNATNSMATGPNFIDPDLPGTDWSILFTSPCRDAGTTPTPTVPNDYSGNLRIGPYDIGAYEVQYSRWRTDAAAPTTWTNTGNWEQGFEPGHSGTTGDIVIPYLANDTYAPNVASVAIASTKYLILKPGAKATLGSLTNSGILKLESDASNISSLITTSFSGTDAQVQLYLTGGYVRGDPYFEGRWHYISSPFSAPLSVTPFTTETYDLARWVDGINGDGTFLPGWVAYDGFIYDIDDPSSPPPYSGTGFNTMLSGKGYNFWDNRLSYTYNLSGQLNTADVVVNLDYAGDPTYQGFNLLGNPFPAGLDWEYIINNTTYPDLTGQGIYFTRNNVQYSYVSGVAVPEFGEPASSGVIPPMQGFFVKTYGAGNSITLSAAAQVHTAPNRYKGKGSIPLIRLSLKEDTMPGDETVVRFDEKALATLDNNFDAVKMFPSTTKTAIYSKIGTTKYSINGQPFPETFVEIPVVVNLEKSGDQVIKATRIDYLDIYTVTLKDNTTGFTADLRTSPELSFFADAPGTISDRFILKVSSITTGIENPLVSKNIFNVYTGNSNINIQTISDEWEGKSGSVRIMDLSGRTFNNLQDAEFRKGSLIQIGAPAAKGMYVVEIRSGVKRYVGKVVIR